MSLRFTGVLAGKEQKEFGDLEINDPNVRINQLAQVLDDWAAHATDSASQRSHLSGIGIRLFNDLIPPDLQAYYWSTLHDRPGATMMILADDGAVRLPWELVKPASAGREAPFWSEHLAISRWRPKSPVVEALPKRPAALS